MNFNYKKMYQFYQLFKSFNIATNDNVYMFANKFVT